MISLTHTFDVSNLPVNQVTVYDDRAEVCRLIQCHINQGISNIIVGKLSDSVAVNSIRVEGYGSDASIVEV